MRCVLYDSWKGKFSKAIQTHWESLGHTVLFDPPWEEMKDADVTFFYQADNVAIEGVTKPHMGKIFVQAVDIEVWAGQATSVPWQFVDGAIFMAPHIQEHVLFYSKEKPKHTALIRPGIDLTKFYKRPLKDFSEPVRRIAYVVGEKRIWDVKRFDTAVKMLYDLLHNTEWLWQLHVLGSYSSHAQYNDYCEHLIQDLKIKDFIVWHPRVDDVSAWLDDKDYLFLDSTKEAFSYATAEAMAKGIKPVLGDWRGAREVWGPYVHKSYLQMFKEFTDGTYEPATYRQYVAERYDQNRYFGDLDNFILGDFNPY